MIARYAIAVVFVSTALSSAHADRLSDFRHRIVDEIEPGIERFIRYGDPDDEDTQQRFQKLLSVDRDTREREDDYRRSLGLSSVAPSPAHRNTAIPSLQDAQTSTSASAPECNSTAGEQAAFKSAALADGVSKSVTDGFDFSCPSTATTVADATPTTTVADATPTRTPAVVTTTASASPSTSTNTTSSDGAIFSADFNGAAGSAPGGPWQFFDAWGGGDWRDAIYDDQHAKLDGNGNLVITGEVGADGKLHTSYLQAYDQANQEAANPAKFGPGTYIEARIDMSGCGDVGSSSWCAFWLFDPSDTYDGNAANGTEMDIVERSAANEWSSTRYTAGNIVAKGAGGSDNAWIEGADPSTGFHTYGVDWQKDKLTYYFDGKPVFETTKGVSGSSNQAAILSIENQNNLWAPNTSTNGPVEMVVDYVKAYAGGKPK